jgi:hypothetical protein
MTLIDPSNRRIVVFVTRQVKHRRSDRALLLPCLSRWGWDDFDIPRLPEPSSEANIEG